MKISDEALLTALLAEGSVRRAARALSISPQSIQRRLNGDLGKRYEDEKSRFIENVSNELTAASELAVKTLADTAADQELPATVRLSAADSLLRHTLRYVETASFERRLKALEEGTRYEGT